MEAKELFTICQQLAEEGPSAAATRRLHELLVLACAEGCRRAGGAFGNLFAQTDYLCKHLGIRGDDRREMQTMRRHSNGHEPIGADEWPYDLRALALLVSAVFAEDVPGTLRRLLPSQPRPHERGLRINRRYLRCIVQSWDDRTITARTADGELLIDYACQDGGRDFGYLRKLLREDMQLNLLECHVSGEGPVVTPGLVIVEPDFLVDISSIAACFTNYGHHPLLYTVNRLKPKPNTQAVLLGNFAGTALDDSIFSGPQPHSSFHTSLKKSFREQALRFCACQDFEPERFKRDATEQLKNIGEAVGLLFDSGQYDRQKALLEPSFVCERLGLQGRADLLTSDLRLLIEQKSGRNPKIEHQSHDHHGLQLESHYVQLLLYYGVLRHNFGRTDQSVDIRLLYSRYPAAQGLMAVNYYQQLLREAIRLRNQIVGTELLVAREGFGRIMPLLTPACIYKDVAKDRIYHEYVEPELAAITTQIAALSPLERAYYERMMTFVYREQLCHKLGSSEARLHHGGGAASDLWLMPLSEKHETGNIFDHLTIKELGRSAAYSGYDTVTLALPAQSGGQENFRRGDMVYLYPYDDQPDVRKSLLYKGTIDTLGTETVSVRLANGQQNPRLLTATNRLWAVEHASADTGTQAAMRGLQLFVGAPPQRKALLLGERPPEADPSVTLSRSYHPDYDDIILRAMQARDYFLLVGPPGTGKTSMALRFIVEESVNPQHSTIHTQQSTLHTQQSTLHTQQSTLLTAYTNRAVDEICAMLTDADMDYLRIGNEAACDERFRNHLMETALSGHTRLEDIRQTIVRTPIIVATTSALQSRQELFQLKHFALAVVDEASQILEPSLIGLLASEQIDRFVLIGDHKQLPAVVQQPEQDASVSDPLLRQRCIDDCRQSLFERLLRWEQHCGRTRFVGTLRRQGRMHPDVALFPTAAFYADEQLRAVPLPHQQQPALGYDLPAQDPTDELLKSRRMLFFDCDNSHEDMQPLSDKVNRAEARMVADLLRRLHRFYGERFSAQKTVGVIVPYRAQIAMIQQEIGLLGMPCLLDVSIDTVERYQGSQRDVIIYSFTITHDYQLDFLAANTFTEHGHLIDRKLNVALTRARCQMIMTGCAPVLRRNTLFRQLIEQFGVEVQRF